MTTIFAKRLRRAICAAGLAVLLSAASPSFREAEPPPETPAHIKAIIAALPEDPQKSVVVNTCQNCHTLAWVARSGATKAAWESRLVRMIRAGAPITRRQIPALAEYLARALPPPMPRPK